MEYVQELVLELDSNTSYTTIGVKQGDNLSRVIKVHLTQNGEDYSIPTDAQAYFRFRKPDGKAVVNAAEIKDNAIEVTLTSQTLAVSGRGYADITLQKNDEVLSTVSFIIIIMAAPGVVDQIVSSNEFGYLNNILSGARATIYESEAWAVGSRGGQSVASVDRFDINWTGQVIDDVKVLDENKPIFYTQTGQQDGENGEYTFTFESPPSNWHLEYRIWDESISPSSTSGTRAITNGLGDYGISYTLDSSVVSPDPGNTITITAYRPDRTYENNAKYYSEQAKEEVQSVVDLEVSAASGSNAGVIKYKDAETNAWHFDFTLPLPSLFSPDTEVYNVEPDPVTGNPGQAEASVTVVEGIGDDSGKVGYKFVLGIPQGRDGRGNVSSVDSVYPVDGNVQLDAVSYGSERALTSNQVAQLKANIGINSNWWNISNSEIDNIVNV